MLAESPAETPKVKRSSADMSGGKTSDRSLRRRPNKPTDGNNDGYIQ